MQPQMHSIWFPPNGVHLGGTCQAQAGTCYHKSVHQKWSVWVHPRLRQNGCLSS